MTLTLTPWKQSQKIALQAALEMFCGNKTHAARYLGISLRTLRNKCIEFGMAEHIYPDCRNRKQKESPHVKG